MKNFEENLRKVEGNIKHEGMELTKEEKELMRRFSNKEMTRDEFISATVELHKNNLKKESVTYETKSEDLKILGSERESNYESN